MLYNLQLLSCKKVFAAALLFGAGVFLFIYSDNTLNNFYYDDGFLGTTNSSYILTEFKTEEQGKNQSNAILDDSSEKMFVNKSSITSVEGTPSNKEYIHLRISAISTRNFGNSTLLPTTESILLSNSSSTNTFQKSSMENSNSDDFLVWSPECKIRNLSPFNEEAMKYFHKEKYFACSKHKLLSYVNISDNEATLFIDKNILPSYTKENIRCCYTYVNRKNSKKNPDEGIKSGGCTNFQDFINLTQPTVKISCRTKKKKIYENVHEAITVKQEFLNSKVQPNKTRVPSILFIGIDSISRLNLIRAMPKTYDMLVNGSKEWLPLNGYNKIGENTFPNLMAIFTGYNSTEAYNICNPKKIGPLDSCRFIWKDYKKFGYVTAYAEDETSINTFNYRKKGFIKEPVDHYFRPYMIAAENLGTVKRHSLSYCAGPESSGDRIMNLAKNFAVAYKDYASFGFFWMNTFSHNDLSTPSMMDERVSLFLEEIIKFGILENSIVIFMSDHGMRFGEIRHTFSGWLEERLPYIFFSFPNWFKKKYPQQIKNFQINSNRLTTPYDVYMTLQHILALEFSKYSVKPIATCPLCKSLFSEIRLNRSCDTTGITAHWCTCGGYNKIGLSEPIIPEAAHFLIGEIEKNKAKREGSQKCAKFHLDKVLTAYVSDRFSYKNDTYLLIVIQTKPTAIFESTLHFQIDAKNKISLSIESSVSRLDSYAAHSKCVADEYLKQYCYCKKDVG